MLFKTLPWAHTNAHHWLHIDHNLSFRSSVTFIHLFIGLFIYLCIHYSLDWLSFYLRAQFRGESGRTFIFWWEQSLIQNRPISRSLSLSVRLFLSVHQAKSLALSLPISSTFWVYFCLCVFFYVLSSLFQSQECLFLSFFLSLWVFPQYTLHSLANYMNKEYKFTTTKKKHACSKLPKTCLKNTKE